MSANPYIAAIGAVVNIGSQIARKVDQGRTSKAHDAQSSPINGGRLLQVVFTGAGQQQVQHLLAKAPSGWLVVGKDANADVWSYAASDSRFLNLQASAAVNLTLMVF